MKDVIVSSLMQLMIVIIATFLLYLFFGRKKESYFKWIGLYKPVNYSWIKYGMIVLISAFIVMLVPLILLQSAGKIPKEMLFTKELSGKGLNIDTIIIILFKAVIQTALSEEILFRGFIGKRIANKFGYLAGNITQSILFGLPHGLPIILAYGEYISGVTLIVSAGVVGYMQFQLNEKKANGSIIPSVCIHGLMNIMSFGSKTLG